MGVVLRIKNHERTKEILSKYTSFVEQASNLSWSNILFPVITERKRFLIISPHPSFGKKGYLKISPGSLINSLILSKSVEFYGLLDDDIVRNDWLTVELLSKLLLTRYEGGKLKYLDLNTGRILPQEDVLGYKFTKLLPTKAPETKVSIYSNRFKLLSMDTDALVIEPVGIDTLLEKNAVGLTYLTKDMITTVEKKDSLSEPHFGGEFITFTDSKLLQSLIEPNVLVNSQGYERVFMDKLMKLNLNPLLKLTLLKDKCKTQAVTTIVDKRGVYVKVFKDGVDFASLPRARVRRTNNLQNGAKILDYTIFNLRLINKLNNVWLPSRFSELFGETELSNKFTKTVYAYLMFKKYEIPLLFTGKGGNRIAIFINSHLLFNYLLHELTTGNFSLLYALSGERYRPAWYHQQNKESNQYTIEVNDKMGINMTITFLEQYSSVRFEMSSKYIDVQKKIKQTCCNKVEIKLGPPEFQKAWENTEKVL